MMMKCFKGYFLGLFSNENRLVFKSPEGGEVQKAESASKKLADLERQIQELQAQKEAVGKELSDLKLTQRAKEAGHRKVAEGAQKMEGAAWEARANDPNDRIREDVARDPKAPPDILTRLARDTDAYVRAGVASNPSTPPDILLYFAQKPVSFSDFALRVIVASNPSTPPDVLARLSVDENYDVRRSVAKHPSTPPDILTRLARDTDFWVKLDVALNPSAPPDALDNLAQDNSFKETVRQSPKLHQIAHKDFPSELRIRLELD